MSARILIIDDSVVMRRILDSALRHSNLELAEVSHAADGIEGLAVLEESDAKNLPLNLILCDVHMPAMNGLDFLLEKQRRNLAPGVPVLMITADASDPQVIEAVVSGAQGFILKPFTLERIKTSVASLLLPPVAPASSAKGDDRG